ncbi:MULTISPECIES: hypothetical protein [Acinetobacter]|uniref:hypothetical protein n=1 Tax=Acinetobacter TaxID=469 RepID=UPI0014402DEB|nr:MULTISPECIES: hypothetical protein [Acinetobacter]MDM1292567.1 hypothetical protein [Acinetobacter indicus]MDM1322580.1 hypothetical protein [Acinetobacter indicus]MDM1325336.1 hypothetical protein [Acinetobacter pseudolwoffii]MDM1334321.1 hypothetical protein [Acinetobacter indicus]QIZ57658.1 hypothetical protein FK537_00070 [Acinetobacter indicus]
MALKGLKKSEQSSQQDQVDEFIKGASKRVKNLEVSQQNYKRYTFSLTEDVNNEIDQLLIDCRVAKANRSIILKAALHQLQKLSSDELQKVVLEEIK